MMAQTSSWLSVGEFAARLAHLGVTEHDARQMAISRKLRSRLNGNHWELHAEAVEEYKREHSRPAWHPWTDPDYRREQADYDDTPTDEGDSEQ